MTEAEAIELIEERIDGLWASDTTLAETKLVMENDAMPQVAPFAMVSFGPILEVPLTAGPAGTRKVECRGLILVKIWVAPNQGRKQFSTLADATRTIFNGQVLSSNGEDLIILAGSTGATGTDGGFFMGMVSFPFRYYDVY